ncbi:ATP-binding protein [Candidatus Fermentibacteria bacterium]|nr:ATP-binding protein [Candidatus Fermentibacteria bacterium]
MPGKQPNAFVDILVAEGLLSKKRARDIIKSSSRVGKSSIELAIEEGAVALDAVDRVAENMGLSCPDLDTSMVDWLAVNRVTLAEAQRIPMAPLVGDGKELRVAVVDPFDADLVGLLRDQFGCPVTLMFAHPARIRAVLAQGPPAEGEGDLAAVASFADFVVDEGQRRVVEEVQNFIRTDTEWRRPVLLVGPGCVGKTHLLNAARQELGSLHPSRTVLFIEGRHAKDKTAPFGTHLSPGGLILDDLDSLAGDARLEEAFMQAFNTVFQQGGPIIVSSSKPLASMEPLSMRVRAALGICRPLTLVAPKQETIVTIAFRVAEKAGVESKGVNWGVLVQEAGGDLRRVLEAIGGGRSVRGAGRVAETTVTAFEPRVSPSEESGAARTAALLREEAEAIISEARTAIDEIEQRPGAIDSELLDRAKDALAQAIRARDSGDFDASEQLGMEALEKAALAHSRSEGTMVAKSPPEAAATPKQSQPVLAPYTEPEGTDEHVKASLREAEKAIRDACDAGAEEYASRELRMAVNGLEEARRIAADPALRARAVDEARLAAEQAWDAGRRAKTRKEEARIKQEKDKVRRCQMAIEEVRKEHERLAVHEGDTPIVAQLEEVGVFIDTAAQYQEVGSIGQALEHVMKARKRLNEISDEARLRRELRDIINEVDGLVGEADKRGETQSPQQLVDIQNALAEAERVLMGDSADYELGLNWARVARQKALRLAEGGTDRRSKDVGKSKRQDGPELTFDSLEVCEGNQFVIAMARTAAETPHLVKSPLYVFGDVGVGKTHLLSAIQDLAKKTHPDNSVVLTTAADFSEDYREALALGKASSFREAYRASDLFILDDLHHIVANPDGIREFFHTLSAIEASGGLAVVSAAVPPRKLGIDDKSFRSRLEGGVTAEMKYPSLEARERILRHAAKRYDLKIPDEAITLLATMITSNVRELLGALGKVAAHSRAEGGQVTGEIMRRVLQEVLPGPSEDEKWLHS